jgi:two-component system, OmpR family, sensor kinase
VNTMQAEGAADHHPKLLATLGQLLAIQATTVKPALDTASTLIADALGADKVDTFLYDSTKHTLVAVGTSATPMGQQQRALGLDRLPLANGGRAVEVFQTGQVYHYGQVDTDLEELRGIREGLGVRSQVCVPLAIDGVRRGVLQADSAQRDAFSVENAHFLEAVANWVGMVIQRAELVEQLTREATQEAQRLVAEELVTVLAHDLGNYLTPLLGQVQILHKRAVREGRAREVRDATMLQQGLLRLQRLIADLLDIGRIEQGVFTVSRQPVNLSEVAREAASALQTAEFRVEIQAPDELVVMVDPNRIEQAIANLLSNARRHAPGSPVLVFIECEQQGDTLWASLNVQDRGPGIAPEVVPHLMKRFVRGRHSQGLGIGLYLARSIAEAHGGTLEVTSTVGQGTTFRLRVPVTTDKGDTAAAVR